MDLDMTKILMATHGPAPDYRIDREAKALADAGHDIYLIHRITKGGIPDTYKKTYQIPLNYWQRALEPISSRIAARKYKKIINEVKPDVIHAHDITAANIVRFVLPKKTKFVYDDHEIWEFLRRRQADATKNLIKKLIVKVIQILTKRINKIITKKADMIVVINEHWINYYEKKGIDSKKIIALENFASKNLFDEVSKAKILVDEFFLKDKRRKIIHSSKLKLSEKVVRDVTNIALAAQELDDWVLVVFGQEDEEFKKLGVKFLEPKPRLEYLTSCLKCDVALNPLILDERFNYSSSNRLYEFVSLGIRIIATPAQTYVDKFNNALIWIYKDTPSEKIVDILKNIDKYPTKEEIRAYAEKYNWEDNIQRLIEKYNSF